MARNRSAFSFTPATKRSVGHAAFVVVAYALFFILFFAPVLFSARVLAPGDGISYFLPSYYARTLFWDTYIWGGFPAVADAPRMFWYPPALLFSLLPHSWHLFLLSAYVLASSFTYGFVFNLTRSRLSAALSGLTYGLCGFMIAHVGHVAIIHSTAWLPLVVWSLERLGTRERSSWFWFTAGTAGIACAALAGHPQMFVYTLMLVTAYALVTGWRTPAGRVHYYIVCVFMMLIGTGIAAIQLLPTAELSALSLRAALTFSDFVAYELPLRQAPMLIFPFLYGGAPAAFYGIPYFGAWPSSADGWGASELTGYVGLLPLMLACVACVADKRRDVVWFWLGVATLAFTLALGEATPFARLMYHLPVINKFRAPARFLFVFAFAVSVLAGLGVNALQRQNATNSLLRRILLTTGLVLTCCLLALKLFAGKVNELAVQRLGHAVSVNPLTNPALFVPLLLFFIVSATLLFWQKRTDANLRSALLLCVMVLDLSSFAWFYEWRYQSPYQAYLSTPAAAANYRAQLDATQQRLLPVRGGLGHVSELPPNLSQLWRLTSASGYGPLILARTSRLLTMPPHGSVDASWRDPANQSLDLMAVRYVLVASTEVEPPATTDHRGLNWSTAEFTESIGPGCAAATPPMTQIDFPQPLPATRLGVVGALACGVELPDGVEFGQVITTETSGATHTYDLRAGRDFSEWAYDCPDVRPAMRHGRAEVFRTYPAQRGAIQCEGHDYVSFVPLTMQQQIKSIALRWTGPPGSFALKKVTVIDDGARNSVPMNPIAGSLHDESRWRYAGQISKENSGYGAEVKSEDVGVARVYENLRARPRAWLTPEVLAVTSDEAFTAVRSSRLSDGRAFDPARLALVEEPVPFALQASDTKAIAHVGLLTADAMEVETTASGPAFLVTSDVYYPGWRATIDGVPARIYQTDYSLRGVAVSAGTHVVRFEFRPRSFYYGAAVSALSFLLLVGCALWLLFLVSTNRSRDRRGRPA